MLVTKSQLTGFSNIACAMVQYKYQTSYEGGTQVHFMVGGGGNILSSLVQLNRKKKLVK